MNESETNLDIAPDTTVETLQAELNSLRTLLLSVLVVVILLSGSVNIFLLRQYILVHTQMKESQKIAEEFDTKLTPVSRDFWLRLVEYSKTHPDFNPIIAKYNQFIVTTPPPNAAPAPKK
jgi:hypothetical protein